ncbi:uncharacterized protein LOC143013485 [Genypterus blacodes]|uniref:uncharacterized protein LOC143013485 n=1 Tax=Genypterus blacodes TaxID=154954 RepID=UPI003F76FC97
MPSLGSKKKENPSRMDRHTGDLPQLSNEMQLSIMNKVKTGELSIDDALDQARKDRQHLLKQLSLTQTEEGQTLTPDPVGLELLQHNFSVHKHGRYRWQKRVLQIDFVTKMVCSIEKGIIKRQLPFARVKSCDDGVGSRFSISFKDHHDYELEATSLEDKHKMMKLVNQIIYSNIYTHPADGNAETHQQPQESKSLREGVLFLHRGGLASFKWVKYEVQLHPGQLILVPFSRRAPTDGDTPSTGTMSMVIHLSDGDTSVEAPHSPDTFTLVTHKNQYHFRVPVTEQSSGPKGIQEDRDAWVHAIHKLCSDWKRRSRAEHMFTEPMAFQRYSIDEETEDALQEEGAEDSDLLFNGGNRNSTSPPSDCANADPTCGGGGDGRADPSAHRATPLAKPRSFIGPDLPAPLSPSPLLSPVQSPTSPATAEASPALPAHPPSSHNDPTSVSTVSESLIHNSGSSVEKRPKVPMIPPPPLPPPLPSSRKLKPRIKYTKVFHWDPVSRDKIGKSFWIQDGRKRIELDTARLLEQFAVTDHATPSAVEPSTTKHIMLDEKIAHNFNIFLKSFPVQPGELKDKLFIVNEDDGGLSDEHIVSLRRYVPTMDDVEKYKSHKGPVADLHIVDQYMMEMCNVPYLSTQLDLLLCLRELPVSMSDLQPLINQKIRMCTQLLDSGSFVSVLEYLLAIGNYLNENGGKEKAKGFRLSSLTKLSLFRGRDKRSTLLHALVEQILMHDSCLATFTQELAEFETVPGASIKGLTAEVDVLKKELQKVIQYSKTSKKRKTGDRHPNFSKDLKMAIEKYNTDLSSLTKKCEEMKKLYSVILVKFGEPMDQDSQELFKLVNHFVQDFKKAHAEMT